MDKGIYLEILDLTNELRALEITRLEIVANSDLFRDIILDIKRINYLIEKLLVNGYLTNISKETKDIMICLREMEEAEDIKELKDMMLWIEYEFEFIQWLKRHPKN